MGNINNTKGLENSNLKSENYTESNEKLGKEILLPVLRFQRIHYTFSQDGTQVVMLCPQYWIPWHVFPPFPKIIGLDIAWEMKLPRPSNTIMVMAVSSEQGNKVVRPD